MEENPVPEPAHVSVKKNIVVYSKHDYIVENIKNILEKTDYAVAGFSLLAEALDYIRMSPFDAVVVGGGVAPHDRMEIQKLVDNDAKMVEHYGGPATILNELKTALGE